MQTLAGKNMVCMERGEGTLRISMEIWDMGFFLDETWASDFSGSVLFPMCEKVLCDFQTGLTILSVEDRDGNLLCMKDVTNDYSFWRSSAVFRSLSRDEMLWKRATTEMETVTGQTIQGIEPALLPALVRFPGYQRKFYDGIPYSLHDESIPKSFWEIAGKLRTPQSAVDHFERSNLPNIKSVRRVLFQNPFMLFFLPELETVWGLLEELHLFHGFLDSIYVTDVLCELHNRPIIKEFLEDYRHTCGTKALYDRFRKEWGMTVLRAKEYVTLGPEGREVQRSQWPEGFHGGMGEQEMSFSMPMRAHERLEDSYTVDDFVVRRLRTYREYHEAAKALSNCLRSWSSYRNPVYVFINEKGEIVAAAEVMGQTVVQKKSYENKEIDIYPGLRSAYDQWLDMANLGDDEYDFYALMDI